MQGTKRKIGGLSGRSSRLGGLTVPLSSAAVRTVASGARAAERLPARRSESSDAQPGVRARALVTLLPIMGVVFVGFLVIGVAMPVLPLHVHDGLGLSTFVVGLV